MSVRKGGSNLHILPLDVDDRESINAAAAAVGEKTGGKLDVLISNAALMSEVNCELRKPGMDTEAAFAYFTTRRGTENNDPNRDDENRLVMRDALGREHAW